MEKIICIILLVLYGLVMLSMCYIDIFLKKGKPKNKVHFYVARDKSGELGLYFGKPVRSSDKFMIIITSSTRFLSNKVEDYGLNPSNYDNLKWEDEPVEVFLNLED